MVAMVSAVPPDGVPLTPAYRLVRSVKVGLAYCSGAAIGRRRSPGALPPLMVLIAILACYVLLGCVMDSLAMILLTIPIFYPMVMGLDFWGMSVPDKSVWFGILAPKGTPPDIKAKLAAGTEIGGRKYRNYIDGYNMLDYFSGKAEASPRNEFWYVGDEGQVMAARYQDWKVVFLENRANRLQIWKNTPVLCAKRPLLFLLELFHVKKCWWKWARLPALSWSLILR